MNSIGTLFRITLFGSSHGTCIGCVIDGIPPGTIIDEVAMAEDLALRKPITGIGTPRKEDDMVQILSGVVGGRSSGSPLTIVIRNKNTDSSAYEKFRDVPRPGHADFTALLKYGTDVDIRGGGQFSGRMTAPLVAAGTIAKEILKGIGIRTGAYSLAIGRISDEEERVLDDILQIRSLNPTRAADAMLGTCMEEEILTAAQEGDSVGGIIKCVCENLPIGIGEPFFDTLEGEISKMIFSIPGVKGIEFGSGFAAALMRGSVHNDTFALHGDKIVTLTNNAGGVLGGISNGMPLEMRVCIKPTASIGKIQHSVSMCDMKQVELQIGGRHDPCIVPRAVPVVEATVAITLVDLCMRGGFIDGKG
ncbi:MAG: chorismate synthase [Methanomicrobiales archaeon]|jgi:chorismate synthase|nr:chorismate synthase [Methanomicrobiales archaeon]